MAVCNLRLPIAGLRAAILGLGHAIHDFGGLRLRLSRLTTAAANHGHAIHGYCGLGIHDHDPATATAITTSTTAFAITVAAYGLGIRHTDSAFSDLGTRQFRTRNKKYLNYEYNL